MPTRKQRRRREKSFRHDYEYVLVDDEGNEVVVPDDERRDEQTGRQCATARRRPPRREKPQKARQPARAGPTSAARVVATRRTPRAHLRAADVRRRLDPRQRRSRRRSTRFRRSFLLAFFLPFSYVMDTIAYRMFLKRTGAADARRQSPADEASSPRGRR